MVRAGLAGQWSSSCTLGHYPACLHSTLHTSISWHTAVTRLGLVRASDHCRQWVWLWQVRMLLAVLRCRAPAGARQLLGVRSGHVRAAAAPPPLLPRPHLLPRLLPQPQWGWLPVTPSPCLWYSPPRVPAAPLRCCCTLVCFQFPLLLNSPFAAAV